MEEVQTVQGKVDFGAGTCPEGFEIRSMTLPQELGEKIRAAKAATDEANGEIEAAITAAGGQVGSYRLNYATDTVQYLARQAEAEV